MDRAEATYSSDTHQKTQHDNSESVDARRTPRFAQPPQSVPIPAGAPEVRRRDYDLILGVPCRLEAQSMEWTVSSQGQVQRVRSIHQIDELIAQINADSPRILLLDEQFATSHLQAIARQLPVRLGECAIGLFADRLSCRQLHMASSFVTGLLSRHSSVAIFMSELDALAAGQKVVSESLRSRVQINKRRRFEVAMVEKIQNLTNRQLEVLIRIAQGMTAKEAAQDLHITEKAVESHKYRLMRAIGVRDRIELCRWAIREGIITA